MKPVDQTILGSEKGNCYAACIASIFEIPIDEVVSPVDEPYWYRDVNAWLADRFGVMVVTVAQVPIWYPGHVILVGTTDRGNHKHACVGKLVDGKWSVVHDPHTSRYGLDYIERIEAFVMVA